MENEKRLIKMTGTGGVLWKVGYQKTQVYAMIRDGEFPAPVKLGKSSRWVESEIDDWIDARIQSRKVC